MEMHQIRYFLAVCETLNFTRAAEFCNVSQPTLTRAIQKLEQELGAALFRRERNLTHVTDFGNVIKPHLTQLIADAEAAKSTATKFLRLEQAPISVGIMCTVGPARFMGFLSAFRSAHPGCELTLQEGVPAELCQKLIEGELDVTVMAQPGDFSKRLVTWPLYRERFCVAFPKGHRFERMEAVRIADVQDEPYLMRVNCEYGEYFSDRCRERGFELHVGFRSEREDWIQFMVAAGFGICFLPEFSAMVSGIQTRPVADPEAVRSVSLVSIAGRRFSPAVASFVRAIRTHNWPETYWPETSRPETAEP